MQGAPTGIGYGLKYQARCISDVKADTDHTSFLAATLSLKEENEVHLIRLNSDCSELLCEGLFSHPNQIWDLASSPFDHRLFSTVFSQGETYSAAIWQIPELYGHLNSPNLLPIATLDHPHSANIQCVLWWPTARHDKLLTIDDQNIFLWNLDASNKTAQVSNNVISYVYNLGGYSFNANLYSGLAATLGTITGIFWNASLIIWRCLGSA